MTESLCVPAALFFWSLALRVAVFGWSGTVEDGDDQGELMDNYMQEAGLRSWDRIGFDSPVTFLDR
jgi:hypothetical protein